MRRLRQALVGLFAVGALSLALVPVGPGSSGSLLAQEPANCGGYSGQLCKVQRNCVFQFWARICTTYYYYYPGSDEKLKEKK